MRRMMMGLAAMGGMIVGLAACETRWGSAPVEEGSEPDGAVVTHYLLSSYCGPGGASERAHLNSAETLDDYGSEVCAAPVEGEAFERIAAVVRDRRSEAPVLDEPFPGGCVAPPGVEDVESRPLFGFADTVLFAARAADGRWIAFNGGDKVRDVDGQLYALDPAGYDAAYRTVLTALVDSDGCPEMTDTFRRWRDGP